MNIGLGDVTVFIYSVADVVNEDDDPADAILLAYPFEMKVDVQCAWCGQIRGLAQFWKTSLRQSLQWMRVDACAWTLRNFQLTDGASPDFTLALGWKWPNSATEASVRNAMATTADLMIRVFRFCSAGTRSRRSSNVGLDTSRNKFLREELEKVFNALLALSSLSFSDMRLQSRRISLFSNATSITTKTKKLFGLCQSIVSSSPASLLGSALFFRADEVFLALPEAIQDLPWMLLVGALRTNWMEPVKELSYGAKNTMDHESLTEWWDFPVFLSEEERDAICLERNISKAAETVRIYSARSSTGGSTVLQPNNLASDQMHLLCLVIRVMDCRLVLLLEATECDFHGLCSRIVGHAIHVNMPFLLEEINQEAVEYLISQVAFTVSWSGNPARYGTDKGNLSKKCSDGWRRLELNEMLDNNGETTIVRELSSILNENRQDVVNEVEIRNKHGEFRAVKPSAGTTANIFTRH